MSKRMRHTTESYIAAAKLVHGDLYDYSVTNFINSSTPVRIVCRKHGEFSQWPPNHLRFGCLQCSKERKAWDISGKVYGLWTVIGPRVKRKGVGYWLCRCECGTERHVRASQLTWNSKNTSSPIGCGSCIKRLPPGETARRIAYANYKVRAGEHERTFDLSIDQFIDITSRHCNYCGRQPSNTVRRDTGHFVYNGIDRVDSSKGYSIDNVVPCCSICNTAKLDMPVGDFKNWIASVYRHLFGQEEFL